LQRLWRLRGAAGDVTRLYSVQPQAAPVGASHPLDDSLRPEEEPEDAILVDSGILPKLIAQAQREPPSLDWEHDLNEV